MHTHAQKGAEGVGGGSQLLAAQLFHDIHIVIQENGLGKHQNIVLGDALQQGTVGNLAVNNCVAELVLAIHEGPLIALHSAAHGLVTDAVGNHLQIMLLCQLAVAVHILHGDPLQAVVFRIAHVAVGHKTRAGAQAAVLKQLQGAQGKPGTLLILAHGVLAPGQVFLEILQVVEADLVAIANLALSIVVHLVQQAESSGGIQEGGAHIVALDAGEAVGNRIVHGILHELMALLQSKLRDETLGDIAAVAGEDAVGHAIFIGEAILALALVYLAGALQDLQELAVDGDNVSADPLQHDGIVGTDLVQVMPVGQAVAIGEIVLVPAKGVQAVFHPLGMLLGELAAYLDQLPDGLHIGDMGLVQRLAELGKVHMRIIETGDQGPAAAIHPGGVSRGIGQQGIAAAYAADDAVLNQNCLLIMTLFYIDLGIIIQLSHH